MEFSRSGAPAGATVRRCDGATVLQRGFVRDGNNSALSVRLSVSAAALAHTVTQSVTKEGMNERTNEERRILTVTATLLVVGRCECESECE